MNPTRKQLDLLKILNPFKGKVAYWEVAEILDISISAVQGRMSRLKRRCPDVYWKFRRLKKDMTIRQRKAQHPITMPLEMIEQLHGSNKIKEIF